MFLTYQTSIKIVERKYVSQNQRDAGFPGVQIIPEIVRDEAKA